jgi:hypothetical protein
MAVTFSMLEWITIDIVIVQELFFVLGNRFV